MARRYWVGIGLLALLLLVSIGLKFVNRLAASEPDFQTMRHALVSALEAGGYEARLASGRPKWWADGLVIGKRGSCTVFLRDATYFGPEFEAISARRMNNGRPLRYIWGDSYISHYPRIRIEVEWRLQREFARLGWRYGISPVIAVGTPEGCWPQPELFQKVRLYYRP
jgi:hypothetical protein